MFRIAESTGEKIYEIAQVRERFEDAIPHITDEEMYRYDKKVRFWELDFFILFSVFQSGH